MNGNDGEEYERRISEAIRTDTFGELRVSPLSYEFTDLSAGEYRKICQHGIGG